MNMEIVGMKDEDLLDMSQGSEFAVPVILDSDSDFHPPEPEGYDRTPVRVRRRRMIIVPPRQIEVEE